MIQWLSEKWYRNQYKLRKYFRETPQIQYGNYTTIWKKVLEYIINIDTEDDGDKFNTQDITVIDDGSFFGTLIFIVHRQDGMEPDMEDYILTKIQYGSCSVCDTLQHIQTENDNGDIDDLPNETQLNDYMLLALHMIQNARWLSDLYKGDTYENN